MQIPLMNIIRRERAAASHAIIGAVSGIEFGSRNYIGRFIVVRLASAKKKK